MAHNNDVNDLSGEIQLLKEQLSGKDAEIVRLRNNHLNILDSAIVCLGLLHRFSNDDATRRDFSLGRFGVDDPDGNILQSIHVITDILLPSPLTSQIGNGDVESSRFLSQLLFKDQSEPLYIGVTLPHRQSFAEWRDLFATLVSSPHWLSVGLGHPVDVDSGQNCGKLGGDNGLKNGSCGVPSPPNFGKFGLTGDSVLSGKHHSESFPKSKLPINKPVLNDILSTAYNNKKCAPIHSSPRCRGSRSGGSRPVVSSSADSSSSSGSSSSGSSRRHRRRGRPAVDSLTSALAQLRPSREVVPPGVFGLDAGMSLRKFLRDYERYFDSKYSGNERDKSRHLREFLDDSLRQVFDAVGGANMKFRDLRPELLEAYNVDRISIRERKYSKFMNASRQPGERLHVYCMRLEQLALRAFPSSKTERQRQLCRRFEKTAPRSFLSKLDGVQGALTVMGESKMSWKDMKRLAETTDRGELERDAEMDTPRSREIVSSDVRVWYNRTDQGPPDERKQPPNVSRPMTFTNSDRQRNRRLQSPPQYRTRSTKLCNWCGKSGHLEADCWQKQGACLTCGSPDHVQSECSRGEHFVCSLCRGKHLGRDCPTNQPPLNW